jgi:hypothetical protein
MIHINPMQLRNLSIHAVSYDMHSALYERVHSISSSPQGSWKRYTVYSSSLCETGTTSELQTLGLSIALEDVGKANVMGVLYNGDLSWLKHL